MKLSLRPRYKQIPAVLILISVSFFLIQSSFKTWLAYSYAQGPQPEGLMRASGVDPENPDYYFLIGYYLNEFDYKSSNETVLTNYREALTLSPLNYNYWFFLAEFLYEEGNREKALYALNQATALSPGTVSLRWRAGMLASKLGDSQSVLDNLHAVIEFDPSRRTKAFSLLWQSIGDGNKIFEIISENALSPYFYYLRKTDRVEYAGVVLEKLKSLNYDTRVVTYKYASDLISKNRIDSAKRIWIDTYGSWEGVWNGNFEEEPLNAGFDWRIGRVEGAEIRRDVGSYNGEYSMMVDFDGAHNVNFRHLGQVIPVEGDTEYTISLYVKSDEISSSEDLKWQVYCLHTPGLDAQTDPISGTHNWQPLTISFKTPKDCTAVNFRLIRNKSNKIGNLISGTVWVDEVKLKRNF